MAAAIQGLPPLPKSLSGLLSFSKDAAAAAGAAGGTSGQQQPQQLQQQQQQLSRPVANRDSFPLSKAQQQQRILEAQQQEQRILEAQQQQHLLHQQQQQRLSAGSIEDASSPPLSLSSYQTAASASPPEAMRQTQQHPQGDRIFDRSASYLPQQQQRRGSGSGNSQQHQVYANDSVGNLASLSSTASSAFSGKIANYEIGAT